MSDKRTPHSELAAQIEAAKERVVVGGIYYHWKNPGQYYQVDDLGFCEWDETLCVIYHQIGKKHQFPWIRRLHGEDGWLSPVQTEAGETDRFHPVKK
jgi:hypothetical protein